MFPQPQSPDQDPGLLGSLAQRVMRKTRYSQILGGNDGRDLFMPQQVPNEKSPFAGETGRPGAGMFAPQAPQQQTPQRGVEDMFAPDSLSALQSFAEAPPPAGNTENTLPEAVAGENPNAPAQLSRSAQKMKERADLEASGTPKDRETDNFWKNFGKGFLRFMPAGMQNGLVGGLGAGLTGGIYNGFDSNFDEKMEKKQNLSKLDKEVDTALGEEQKLSTIGKTDAATKDALDKPGARKRTADIRQSELDERVNKNAWDQVDDKIKNQLRSTVASGYYKRGENPELDKFYAEKGVVMPDFDNRKRERLEQNGKFFERNPQTGNYDVVSEVGFDESDSPIPFSIGGQKLMLKPSQIASYLGQKTLQDDRQTFTATQNDIDRQLKEKFKQMDIDIDVLRLDFQDEKTASDYREAARRTMLTAGYTPEEIERGLEMIKQRSIISPASGSASATPTLPKPGNKKK